MLDHAIRLDHFTLESLGWVMREFLIILADDGTEAAGGTLRIADSRSILPYIQDTLQRNN